MQNDISKENVGGVWEDVDMTPTKFEIGEVLMGKLTAIRSGHNGSIYVFDGMDGTLYNKYGSAQLDAILTPDKIGRTFRIVHTEMATSASGRPVRRYKVQILKEG